MVHVHIQVLREDPANLPQEEDHPDELNKHSHGVNHRPEGSLLLLFLLSFYGLLGGAAEHPGI